MYIYIWNEPMSQPTEWYQNHVYTYGTNKLTDYSTEWNENNEDVTKPTNKQTDGPALCRLGEGELRGVVDRWGLHRLLRGVRVRRGAVSDALPTPVSRPGTYEYFLFFI